MDQERFDTLSKTSKGRKLILRAYVIAKMKKPKKVSFWKRLFRKT